MSKIDYAELKPHKYADIWPMMNAGEYGELLANIRANGYDADKPIVLYKGEILDGRNRRAAAIEAGVTPTHVLFEGNDADALASVEKSNIRRNLSQSQKSIVMAKLAPLRKGAGRQSQEDKAAGSEMTQQEAADVSGASRSLIQYGVKVEAKGCSSLLKAVTDGSIKVSDAAKIVDQTAEVQRKIVNMVKAGDASNCSKALKMLSEQALAERASSDSPAEPEPVAPPPVDDAGIPIQDYAAPAFEARPMFDELEDTLKRALRIFGQLADLPGGAYLTRAGIGVNARERWTHEGLRRALKDVQNCKPSLTVCPFAYATAKGYVHDKDCDLCKGLNWSRQLGKSEVDEDLIAKAKKAFKVK